MKCLIDITDPENVIRVKDAAAYQLVNSMTGKTRGRINGNYDYCPKTKFKRIHGTKAQKAKIAGFAPPSEKG